LEPINGKVQAAVLSGFSIPDAGLGLDRHPAPSAVRRQLSASGILRNRGRARRNKRSILQGYRGETSSCIEMHVAPVWLRRTVAFRLR
jgi:hypothetical protein